MAIVSSLPAGTCGGHVRYFVNLYIFSQIIIHSP